MTPSTDTTGTRDVARRDPRTVDLYRGVARQVMQARVRAGLTQRQLAALIGTTASVICRLESGEHRMSVETLDRVCQALDMHVEIRLHDGR